MLNNRVDKRICWGLGFLVIFLYLIPYILLGEDAYITIHDFLDSNVAHQTAIIKLGLVGNPDGILPVMEGIPSLNYVPLIPLDVKTLLYVSLPTYWAIVVNTLFVKVCAFSGMFLLLSTYVIRQHQLKASFVSVCYALIPFYIDYGLSAAGVPFFIYAALNLENCKRLIISYVIIILFAINSSLALSGFFVCILWSGWIAYSWWRKKRVPKYHIYGLMFVIIVYLFTNVSVIYNFLFPSGIVSHRVEFGSAGGSLSVLEMLAGYIMVSQYHAGSFAAIVILGISFAIFYSRRNRDSQIRLYTYLYFLILSLITVGCLIRLLPFSTGFQFDRFYFLYPSLCFILFAKALSLINKKTIVVLLVTIALVSVLIFDKEAIINELKLTAGYELVKKPSYRQFEDKELFCVIKKDLGMNEPFKVKVACVGMFPSVAEMNQIYTVDSYVYSYSLDYKHKFRKVIEKELEKNETLKDYYDQWGSRCYVFSSELDEKNNRYLCSKEDDISVNHLDINTKELKALGCEFIFSAVNIKNYQDLNLQYIKDYTTEKSYWDIKVYKLQ